MSVFPPHDEDRSFDGAPLNMGNGEWEPWVQPAEPFVDHTLIPCSGGWSRDDAPFVYQNRDKLLLLVGNAHGWLLAELRFDRRSCTYVESRRSTFAWPREALTALLSRIVTGTDEDDRVLRQVSDDFHAWASRQLVVAHRLDGGLCSLSGN